MLRNQILRSNFVKNYVDVKLLKYMIVYSTVKNNILTQTDAYIFEKSISNSIFYSKTQVKLQCRKERVSNLNT